MTSDLQARSEATTNISDTLLVEAGAGTGKTTLLIDRICALIESGVKAERIAAVTFTVKAAGELKERLREKLKEKSSDVAKQALLELDRMTVNTIHGLAAELLRTLPVEAKLPPEFTALDELQQTASADEFCTNWLSRALDMDTPPCLDLAAQMGLNLVGSESKGLTRLFNTLNKSLIDIDGMTCGDSSLELLEQLRANILADIPALAQHAALCAASDDKLYLRLTTLIAALQSAPANFYSPEGVTWLGSARTPSGKAFGARANWPDKETLEEAREQYSLTTALLSNAKQALTSLVCAEIVQWIAPAVTEYREQLRERGTLGFDDLLFFCRNMLRDSKTARDYFKTRYDYVHIDEFQDTDPIQVEILFYLSERKEQFTSAWFEVELEPGKLFVVGDPKQSIYRFRGADLRIYNNVATRIEKAGKRLSITTNFRSRPTILSEVNEIFAPVMTGQSDSDALYQPLLPSEKAIHDPAAVELLLPPENYDRLSYTAEQAAQQEAEVIADHLLTIAGADKQFKFSDIAILLKANTSTSAIVRALSARNIPFISFMNSAFTARVEIEAVLTMLHALADPQHTVAAVGTLRSPWFALSDDDLLAHKFSGRSFIYTEPQPADTQVGNALSQMLAWHKQSRNLSGSELLEALFADFPIDVFFGMKSDGTQRVQNMHLLVELVRKLEQGGVQSLSEIVARVSDMTRLVQSTELEARDESRDAVQILTLHKAKGLEFPVVYLYAFRDKLKNSGEWQLLKSLNQEPHQLALSVNSEFCTQNYNDVKQVSEAEQKLELQRLLYVGMTRAKDKLILPLGWRKTSNKNPDPVIPQALAARYQLDKQNKVALESIDAVQTSVPPQVTTEFRPFSSQLHVSQTVADESIELFNQWQSARADRVNTLNPPQLPEQEPETESATEWSRVRARLIGTYVHAVLEQLVKGKSLVSAERLASRTTSLAQDAEEEAQAIIASVMQSQLFTVELPAAKRVITELPIVAASKDVVTAQFVDLIFETAAGEWILLDYKTDDIPSDAVESRKEKHRKQLAQYAEMFTKIMGNPPAEVRVYFLRPNKMVKL